MSPRKDRLERAAKKLVASAKLLKNPLLERGYFITPEEHNAAVDAAGAGLLAEIRKVPRGAHAKWWKRVARASGPAFRPLGLREVEDITRRAYMQARRELLR